MHVYANTHTQHGNLQGSIFLQKRKVVLPTCLLPVTLLL